MDKHLLSHSTPISVPESDQERILLTRWLWALLLLIGYHPSTYPSDNPAGQMRPATPARSTSRTALTAPHLILRLPATFKGILPCDGCEGVRAQLDLWPDGVFHLQRRPIGNASTDDDRGRWRMEPERSILLLYGGREMPLTFEVIDPNTLRLHGLTAGHDLQSDGVLMPADLSLGLHGMFRYMADAALFEECLTGRAYPVAMEDDYLTLERAYLTAAKSEPGTSLMASFDGEITLRPAMEGSANVPTVIVRRFIGIWPGQNCARAMTRASLVDQYWRIASLRGQVMNLAPGQREPRLLMNSGDKVYRARAGCTDLTGSYIIEGNRISFTAGGETQPVCPNGLADSEKLLAEMLASARTWSIEGQVLELFEDNGKPVATFEAVYLR